MKLLVLVGCLCALTRPAVADRADDLVRQFLAKQHVPGCWVVVIKDGKVVKRKGYGFANLELRVPVTPETMMQTGSIGKMFTSTGVMILVTEGKLHLDDSLASFFDHSPDWWKPITIRRMLSHTAGIPDYEDGKVAVDLKRNYTEAELVDFCQKLKPDFQPGENWSYSNTDYLLLGFIIHKVTGQFYGDFLKERVWKPASMPTMRVINDIELVPNRAAGYDWVKGKWQNQDWVSPMLNSTADGALYATADDFIAWDHALDNYKILPKAVQQEMWTPARLNNGKDTVYGYAWVISKFQGHRMIWHNGSWQGFVSQYARFPDDHLSVAVFCNGSNARPESLAVDLAAVYVPSLAKKG